MTLLLLLSGDPPELAGGRYPAPAWVILALGGIVAVAAAVHLAVRALSRWGRGRPHTPGAGKEKR